MKDIRQALQDLDIVDEQGRHLVVDPAMVDLALAIYDVFSQLCQARYGECERISAAKVKHLYKAALLCAELGETPELFVNKQLTAMDQFGKRWVTALGSRQLHDYSDSNVDITLDAIRYYKSQLALFTSRVRLYGPVTTLEDPSNDFSPLFRYTVALKLGLSHIAEAYKAPAMQELSNNPVARDVFGTKLEREGSGAPGAPLSHSAGSDPTIEGTSTTSV